MMKAVISLIGFYQVSVVNVQSRLLVRILQCINYIRHSLFTEARPRNCSQAFVDGPQDRIDFWASVSRVTSKYLTEEPRRKPGF